MSASPTCTDVFAIIVTHDPDLQLLDSLVQCLLPQVGAALVVDNGSTPELASWHAARKYDGLQLHSLHDNLGIAAAQNVGLELARKQGARFALLSDQDSQPAPDMVWQLKATALRLLEQGIKVGAVGPSYRDPRHGASAPFIHVKGLKVERRRCSDATAVIEADYLVASGCLVSLAAVAVVGAMKEELFIDYVDIEWGLRARKHDYLCYGTCAAVLTHRLGDAHAAFMGRRFTLHSPLRHYYYFRNAVWLYRQGYVPWHWKLADGLRLAQKYFLYCLIAKPRRVHWRMMTAGIWDGLRSRLGRA
jgi:rhamnosyltransferase